MLSGFRGGKGSRKCRVLNGPNLTGRFPVHSWASKMDACQACKSEPRTKALPNARGDLYMKSLSHTMGLEDLRLSAMPKGLGNPQCSWLPGVQRAGQPERKPHPLGKLGLRWEISCLLEALCG